MKTLIILAHPDIRNSTVNRRWKQELEKYPEEFIIHELYEEYPDWNIEVDKEQQLLESSDHIIIQFPLYWYSYPPLLKKWMDEVFAYGWAYGKNGNKLVGKKIGLAMSIGDKEENYSPSGSVGFSVDEIIIPFKATTNHIGAIALSYFTVFRASFQIRSEEVEQSAKDYLRYLQSAKSVRD